MSTLAHIISTWGIGRSPRDTHWDHAKLLFQILVRKENAKHTHTKQGGDKNKFPALTEETLLSGKNNHQATYEDYRLTKREMQKC